MNKLPDLEAWALFARVIETGSFAKAAESVGISQPTVSKAISRLEARLGTPLMRRTPRGFVLTAAGEVALEKARRILHEGEAAELEASQEAAAARGLVRLAAPASFALEHIVPLLPHFYEQYPDIDVELSLSDHFVDLFLGDIDLAVRIGALVDSSLRARTVCGIGRRLVASPAYLEKHGRPDHPRDLGRHQCLTHFVKQGPEAWHFHGLEGKSHSIVTDGRFRTDMATALLPMVLAHQGIALMPDFLVRGDLAAGRLEQVLPDWRVDDLALSIVLPPGKMRPARVTVLKDYLCRALADQFTAGTRQACREVGQPAEQADSAHATSRRSALGVRELEGCDVDR